MKVELLSISRKKAYNEWKRYRELCKEKRKDIPYAGDMKKLYNCLKSGRKVIDIYEAFKKTGVNSKQEPKLAIAIASWKTVYFRKENTGRGVFQEKESSWNISSVVSNLPNNTFPDWEHNVDKLGQPNSWNIKNQVIKTQVPIVPAKFVPKGNLANCHILWEVERWDRIPKDPILLKKITKNLYVILAVWDLTPIERALIRGR